MQSLIGSWITDPALEATEQVKIEFKEDGQLIYTIFGEETDQILLLTYRVEGDILITDQPSHPKEERTKFLLTPDDKLILIYGDDKYQYVRFG